MWVQAEIWDKLAEGSSNSLGKGSFLNGVGTMICDKWIDKNTGEEKKMFKLRILKLLSKEAMNGIVAAMSPEVNNDLEQSIEAMVESAAEAPKEFAEKLVLPEGMEDNVTDDIDDEEAFPPPVPPKQKVWNKSPPKKFF
jgi:single-stranded DNA-binding protein